MNQHLEDAQERRAGLRTSMGDLEAALASPAGGRDKAWRLGVREALDELAGAIDVHIQSTEVAGGVLDDIAGRSPALKPAVDRARSEHQRLQYLLEVSTAAVDDTKVDPAAVRERAVELLGAVMRHRQDGAELVYDAYNVHLDVEE